MVASEMPDMRATWMPTPLMLTAGARTERGEELSKSATASKGRQTPQGASKRGAQPGRAEERRRTRRVLFAGLDAMRGEPGQMHASSELSRAAETHRTSWLSTARRRASSRERSAPVNPEAGRRARPQRAERMEDVQRVGHVD
jgi:hypothetical protein